MEYTTLLATYTLGIFTGMSIVPLYNADLKQGYRLACSFIKYTIFDRFKAKEEDVMF